VITTVFSPNNDGINDEFIISCLEGGLFKDNTLVVYNQWGDKVYSASPYKNDWKGTYNGDDLPDGTYFYVFRKDATSPFEKGFVMIQR
jgi:gliding motility-associated-like protein